jgi:Tol biopolymer transport system component
MKISTLAFTLFLCWETCGAADKRANRPHGTIAFASQTPRGWDLYTTDVNARQTQRLTNDPALDYNAAVSRDGKRLAVSEQDGNMEIYAMNADGSDPKRLTHEFALDDHPSWSPDGKQLVFTSTRQPSGKPGQSWNALYLMNADGSGVRRLSPPDVTDLSPAWSRRHGVIAFGSPGQGVGIMKRTVRLASCSLLTAAGPPSAAKTTASTFTRALAAGAFGRSG